MLCVPCSMILGIDASRANKKERTGVEWYSYFLIQKFKHLIPQNIKVILYTREPLLDDLLPLPPNWEVKVLHWPFRFWTLIRLSWEMLLHKPDMLFVPSHILPFFIPKNSFTTIHDIGFKRFPESYGYMQRKILDFGIRRAKKAKTIFTPSNFTKKELIEVYKLPEEKIKPIYLGYNNAQYNVQSPTLHILEKYGIKKPYLFYVGRLEKKKNIENIIKSVKGLDIMLVLAGNPGFGWEEIPASAGMTEMVKLLGWVDQKDVLSLMANAEIFLFPTLYEGFGIPILEAMASGTPVITSNRASMPEVAGDSALLVNPDNPQEITNAINKILQNPELKNNLKQKGLLRSKEFDWEKTARKTLNNILK